MESTPVNPVNYWYQKYITLRLRQKDAASAAAYDIVCVLTNAGLVKSEPEGLEWETRIAKMIEEQLGKCQKVESVR